ncbi:MAG: N-acetylglutamate synthase [Campylobacteraceae bacterium]|nr:N-acetylglutamate synthase [Campylobacteraceae bacterium]
MENITQTIKTPNIEEITTLLKQNNLPIEDIKELNLKSFFGLYINDTLEGIVGLEVYNEVALLRSLAVGSNKSFGIGSKLLEHIDYFSKTNNINTLYLLTTTADKYFLKKGFVVENKNKAPKVILNTKEFNSICPDSSIFMKKELN